MPRINKDTARHLPLKLTISRRSSAGVEDCIGITISDDISGLAVVEAEIDMAGFAEAVTGHAFVSCEGDVFVNNRIGCVREHKTEMVMCDKSLSGDERDKALLLQVKAFEGEGCWTASMSDLGNHHRSCMKDDLRGYRVSFERWVDANGNPVEV